MKTVVVYNEDDNEEFSVKVSPRIYHALKCYLIWHQLKTPQEMTEFIITGDGEVEDD